MIPVASLPRHATVVGDDGILYVRIFGFWRAADVARFFDELIPIHAEARRRYESVRALIEVETVQSPLVVVDVHARAVRLKRPGDRNAVLVATALSMLQIKRLGTTDAFGLFTDRTAAREWLLA